MKFGDLKIGERFTFEGRLYVKVSPMIARATGNAEQKFLRRSAEVEIETAAPAKSKGGARPLTQTEVAAAFGQFYAHCERCLLEVAQHLAPESKAQTVAAAREQLARERQRFLDTLK